MYCFLLLQGAALILLERYSCAESAFKQGLQLCPHDQGLLGGLKEVAAILKGEEEDGRQQAYDDDDVDADANQQGHGDQDGAAQRTASTSAITNTNTRDVNASAVKRYAAGQRVRVLVDQPFQEPHTNINPQDALY